MLCPFRKIGMVDSPLGSLGSQVMGSWSNLQYRRFILVERALLTFDFFFKSVFTGINSPLALLLDSATSDVLLLFSSLTF